MSADPAAVARGRARIEHELGHALVLPRVADAIRAILAVLDGAYTALRSPAQDVTDPTAHAAGILIAAIDGYLAALAALGGDR